MRTIDLTDEQVKFIKQLVSQRFNSASYFARMADPLASPASIENARKDVDICVVLLGML